MEKLQPVLKHIFWILFGLAAMLILIGWWMAKGALSTQIEARKAAVDKAFTDAQVNVSAIPNSNWTDGATKINETHQKAFDESALGLWKEQLDARTYPAAIRDEMSKLKYGSTIEQKRLRDQFAQVYRKYFMDQLRIIKPFIDGEGLVDVSDAQITQENETRWATKRPTSQEIWNAQEDIWLLGSVFHSIAAVNEGAERIDKAPLRSLLKLQLRGGDRNATPGSSGGGGGFGGMGDMGGGYESGMAGAGFGGAGVGGGASQPWKQFEGSQSGDLLTEEFGSVGGGAAGGMDMMGASSYESGGGGFGGGGAEPVEENRYVDQDESLPYRTRAFQLEVKILQQDIPALLAELTNSRFPVEIVRVDATFGRPSGSMGMMAGAAAYGMDGGGAYESGGGGETIGGFGGMGGGMGGGVGGGGMAGIGGFGATGGGFGADPTQGFGGQGMGMGSGGLGAPKRTRAAAKKNAIGSRLLAAAMDDDNLATVRVAGLMTMYRSPQENEAEAATEAAATLESQEAGGVQLPPAEPLGGETSDPTPADPTTADPTTADPAMQPDSAVDPNSGNQPLPRSEGGTPAEGAAPAAPAAPAAADGVAPSTPGTTEAVPGAAANPAGT